MKSLLFKESPLLFLFVTLLFGIIDKLFIDSERRKLSALLFIAYIIVVCMLLYMYRLPHRKNSYHRNIMIAPSDGLVKSINKINDEYTHVAIYLNLLDTHVQWFPLNGIVKSIVHKKGTFKPAYLLEKSKYNERVETVLYIPEIDEDIKIVQIAGHLARRIVNYSKVDNQVKRGDLLGMIKFSSRVDLFIPHKKIKLLLRVDDRLLGNKTIIGRIL
jgi:phosphatidylserine decarboxylase